MNRMFGGGDNLQAAGAFFKDLPLRALVAFGSASFIEKDLGEILKKTECLKS